MTGPARLDLAPEIAALRETQEQLAAATAALNVAAARISALESKATATDSKASEIEKRLVVLEGK